jgi:hypothetical protein
MTRTQGSPSRDERGLVGKLLVVWLVAFGLLFLALWDGGSIGIAYLRNANLAQDAARAGAERFEETGERVLARQAVMATVTAADGEPRIEDLKVSRRGDVTVVVTDRAGTLVAGRIGFVDDLTVITSTASASPR